MKVKTEELKNVLGKVRPSVATAAPMGEAQVTHFIFTGEHVAACDNRTFVRYPFETDFTCSVDARDMYALCDGLSEGEAEIGLDNGQLRFAAGSLKAGLRAVTDNESWEWLPTVGNDLKWKKLPKGFTDGLSLCSFAASTNSARGAYQCVHVLGKVVEASDGLRISRYALKTAFGGDGVLLPAAGVSKLVAFPVEMAVLDGAWAHFRTEDGVVFGVRLMEGEFADLGQFLEVEGGTIEVPKELKAAIGKVSVLADAVDITEKQMSVSIAKGKITCRVEGERGWVEETVKFGGKENAEFVTNPAFFARVLDEATKLTIGEKVLLFEAGPFRHAISRNI